MNTLSPFNLCPDFIIQNWEKYSIVPRPSYHCPVLCCLYCEGRCTWSICYVSDINIDRGGRIRLAKRMIWRPFHAVSIQALKFWMFAKWWNLPLNIQGEDCVCKTYSFGQMSSTATDFCSCPLYAKCSALLLDISGCFSPFTSQISQDVPTCPTWDNAQSPRSQMSLHLLGYSDLSNL